MEKQFCAFRWHEISARDRTVRANRYIGPFACETSFRGGINHPRALETLHDEDWMVRYRVAQLLKGWKADGLCIGNELVAAEAADRRHPLAWLRFLCSRRQRRERLFDGVGVLEACIAPRTQAEQQDVVVVVDDPRHHRAAVQVDRASAFVATVIAAAMADSGELAVLDQNGGHDGVVLVHRVYLPVDEPEAAARLAVFVVIRPGGRYGNACSERDGAEPRAA